MNAIHFPLTQPGVLNKIPKRFQEFDCQLFVIRQTSANRATQTFCYKILLNMGRVRECVGNCLFGEVESTHRSLRIIEIGQARPHIERLRSAQDRS